MPLFQLFLVAVIQGLTEFLPVSSSGHLILLPGLTGMQDQGQLIDVAVHVGTLGAVILYFWSDVWAGLVGLLQLLVGRTDTPGAKLALGLIVATIPVILCGAVLHFTGLSDAMRSVTVIGWTMLVFGIVLYWADQTGGETKTADRWTVRDALTMGLWQAVSLIPGTSRSGITMTAGLALGLTRSAAARFSFLLSIPVILLAGGYESLKLVQQSAPVAWGEILLGTAVAAISAYLCIHFFMRLIERIGMLPFVVYRLLLGVFLLLLFY